MANFIGEIKLQVVASSQQELDQFKSMYSEDITANLTLKAVDGNISKVEVIDVHSANWEDFNNL